MGFNGRTCQILIPECVQIFGKTHCLWSQALRFRKRRASDVGCSSTPADRGNFIAVVPEFRAEVCGPSPAGAQVHIPLLAILFRAYKHPARPLSPPVFSADNRLPGGFKVPSQEERTYPLIPGFGPPFQSAIDIMCCNDARNMIEKYGVRDVVERADHAGNIFNWRPLDAPLTHWTRIVSVKVLDDVITSGVKHVSQMVVTMMTGSHPGNPRVTKSSETFTQRVLSLQHRPRFFLGRTGRWPPDRAARRVTYSSAPANP